MEPPTNKKSTHLDQRKREKASKKKAKARKKEAIYRNYGYYGPFNSRYGYGYGYGYGHPYPLHDGYCLYLYGRLERYHNNEYVSRAPLRYRDGFNHYGNSHFEDTNPYRCYQSFYETPVMSFPQAPLPHQTHPFYTPKTICSVM